MWWGRGQAEASWKPLSLWSRVGCWDFCCHWWGSGAGSSPDGREREGGGSVCRMHPNRELGMCSDQEPPPFTLLDDPQPTEPRWPGRSLLFLNPLLKRFLAWSVSRYMGKRM